ncbi:MAG TPA: hypothetical protein VLA43_02035 [Longimicrobiales bacterium]|nr:hypothetical protein [Longimicrobiales bacterium]
MSRASTVLAVAVTLGLVVALGALSRIPLEGDHAGDAAVRLAWRVRAEEVGGCRRPTAEELAELPVHMQNPDACVGSIPPFRLTAEVDGATLADAVVEAAGARGDRPLYVYREIILEPGTHQVRVRFTPENGAVEEGDLVLAFEGPVALAPGQILLLTRAQSDGALEVRAPVR